MTFIELVSKWWQYTKYRQKFYVIIFDDSNASNDQLGNDFGNKKAF